MNIFLQLIEYKAMGGAKNREVKEIACLTHPSVPGHSEDSWSGDEMVIPQTPPSFLGGCSIIDIKYELQVIF